MWGVCLDINAPELFQTVVQYGVDEESGKAVILSPESACGSELESVKPLFVPPEFVYGARVSPLNHPEVEGSIARIFWHFEQGRYCYKIEVNGKLKSKRYFAEELMEV